MAKAKRGGVFGMLRGSVGPATYSIGKDGAGKRQQIVREKPVEVANPRTRAQAIQRMKMVPIQFAMSLLSDIVDHSFRGVQEGWPSKRYFMSLAMKELDVPFIRKGSLNRAIGGYQISAGTLGDTRSYLTNMANLSSLLYELKVPSTKGLSLPLEQSTGRNWADFSRFILDNNPTLQDGDEIAVIAFIVDNAANAQNVRVVKRRMLIDTNFTTETPAEFVVTVGEGDNEFTYNFNTLYAATQYNDNLGDLVTYMRSNAFVNQLRSASASDEFNAIMGFDYNNGEDYVYLVKPGESADDFTGVNIKAALIPQVAAEVVNGALAATSLVISRRVGDSWNYTISDICLTAGYLATVNNNALMEAAIASYMTETGVDTSYSEYYLQLTQEQAENYGIASVDVSGSILVGETTTAVNARIQGRVNPMTGKNILFVNADGYVISDGAGADVALSYGGFRWRNASTGAYIAPTTYVKASEISDTSNIEFAELVD